MAQGPCRRTPFTLALQEFKRKIPEQFRLSLKHVDESINELPGTVGLVAMLPDSPLTFYGRQINRQQFPVVLSMVGLQNLPLEQVDALWQMALLHSETASKGLVDERGFLFAADHDQRFRAAFRYSYVPVYKDVHAELRSQKNQNKMLRIIK